MRRGLPEPADSPGLAALLELAREEQRAASALLAAMEGEEPEPTERAALTARLQALDALVTQIAAALAAGDPGGVDAGLVGGLLGAAARAGLERLRQAPAALVGGGFLQAVDGRYELTSRAARRLGQLALRDLFARLRRDRSGGHAGGRRGQGVEPTEQSAPYRYGDPFHLDLRATLGRAVTREGRGTPVRLTAGDFAVFGTEPRVGAATALLLDVSRSMLLRGCFAAGKQVALALQTLIQQRYRGDHLTVLTFAHGARETPAAALPQLTIDEREYGTNLHAALRLARARLRRHPSRNKQIIVVTDGEPTAHLRDGGVFFAYPPTPRTIEATLREVARCTEERIVVNVFMLERGQHLTDFVGRLARLNQGRSFFVAPDRLGEYLLLDYVAGRTALARR
jgi:uncharacterized protein with von Willebrand factor type A (vWA) domain